jgi:hypothetical protein
LSQELDWFDAANVIAKICKELTMNVKTMAIFFWGQVSYPCTAWSERCQICIADLFPVIHIEFFQAQLWWNRNMTHVMLSTFFSWKFELRTTIANCEGVHIKFFPSIRKPMELHSSWNCKLVYAMCRIKLAEHPNMEIDAQRFMSLEINQELNIPPFEIRLVLIHPDPLYRQSIKWCISQTKTVKLSKLKFKSKQIPFFLRNLFLPSLSHDRNKSNRILVPRPLTLLCFCFGSKCPFFLHCISFC